MISPQNFKVGEAWAAFSLKESTVFEGENFDLVTLVDVASGKELCRAWLPVAAKGTSIKEARDFLENALRANEHRVPERIILPKGSLADLIEAEAARKGIRVKSVPEYELRELASERLAAFSKMLAERRAGDA